LHNPKILVLVGVLVFGASIAWMYSKDRARTPENMPAAAKTTTPQSTIEPGYSTALPARAAPTSSAVQSDQQTRPQETSVARTGNDRSRDAGGAPSFQNLQSNVQRPDEEVETVDSGPRLSISGRVLDSNGAPVSGTKLTARHRGSATGPRDSETHETRSSDNGDYEFSGLIQGDYDVRTVATTEYPAVGALFRAGMRSADIVLSDTRTIQISGRVSDTAGQPLADVEVKPSGKDAVTVWTDGAGNFRTQAPGGLAGTTFSVTFRRESYVEKQAYVSPADVNSGGEARLDVQLLSLAGTVKVSGILRGADGNMVAGESVQLDSPSLNNRYRETSQSDGSFEFPAVEPGGDYRLTVHPRSAYESHYQQSIDIQPPSLLLSATLKPLETGRLTGRMMDEDGRPIGGFTMTLRSNKSQSYSVNVTGDDGGYFTNDNAPAGNLTFATRSKPQFSVSGINLQPGGSVDAELVIDWGDTEFTGQALDGSNRPVAGASVQLSGRFVGRGIQSSSLRRTTTDADGRFRFSELGGGMHTLTIKMNGFETATQAIDTSKYIGHLGIELVSIE
jgi:protocatechuate 3,4-dioxygenase beta subunit